MMIQVKKLLFLTLLSMTLITAKGAVDIGKIISPSFSQGSTISQKQFTLTTKESSVLQKKAKAKLDSRLIRMYTVKKGKKVEGYGVLVIKKVRTKKTAVLYMIDREKNIKNIEILAFNEPSEYKPNKAWRDVFTGKSSHDNLYAGRGIPTISGATLSARAVTDASRIALAIVELYR
jgi:hypothetical protein